MGAALAVRCVAFGTSAALTRSLTRLMRVTQVRRRLARMPARLAQMGSNHRGSDYAPSGPSLPIRIHGANLSSVGRICSSRYMLNSRPWE